MKNKLLALIISLSLIVSCFSGCSLLSVNEKRDMAQVIATVTTTGEDVNNSGNNTTYSDDILKRELVSSFNSMGYYYVSSYGYTYQKTYELLMDSLVNRKILLQEAKRSLAVVDSQKEGLSKYLDTNQIIKCTYDVKKSINELIDSFEKDIIKNLSTKEEETDEQKAIYAKWEGYKDTLRTVITGADKSTEEVKLEDCTVGSTYDSYSLILDKASEVEGSTAGTRKKAYNKMTKAITYYELSENDFDTFTNSSFFLEQLDSQFEQAILDKYIEELKSNVAIEDTNATVNITFNEILDKYSDEYNKVVNDYKTLSNYQTALNDLTDDGYVLFNPYDNYGYVYNILIPFNKAQEIDLKNLKALNMSDSQYLINRRTILNGVKGKDLRASWITNDYEIDLDTKLFEDKMYANTELYAGYPFQGTVTMSTEADDGIADKFKINAEENSIDEIINKFLALYDGNYSADTTSDFYTNNSATYVKSAGTYSGSADNLKVMMAKVKDFMFAYSTDVNSMNYAYGYYYPYSSTFMAEFAKACEYVIDKGAGSYAVVGTDYGWHIVYCTKTIEKTNSGSYISEYTLNQSDIAVEDSFTKTYVDKILTAMKDEYYSEELQKLIAKYRTDDNVKIYAKRYKDLILD